MVEVSLNGGDYNAVAVNDLISSAQAAQYWITIDVSGSQQTLAFGRGPF